MLPVWTARKGDGVPMCDIYVVCIIPVSLSLSLVYIYIYIYILIRHIHKYTYMFFLLFLQGIFGVAKRFFLLFQQHASVTTAPALKEWLDHEEGFHSVRYLGTDVVLLSIDMRTRRTKHNILPEVCRFAL